MDRISLLPDTVLLHILTFVPIKTAGSTSLLSKRWANLWTSIPVLSFQRSCDSKYRDFYRFASFVDDVLLLHNSDYVQRFSVDLRYPSEIEEPNSDGKLCIWSHFAVRHFVKELELKSVGDIVLPPCLCNNETITKLSITCHELNCDQSICWNSLKYLELKIACWEEFSFPELLAGCPRVEELTIRDTKIFDTIEISTSAPLKKLVVENIGERDHVQEPLSEFIISVLNLRSLVMCGTMYRTNQFALQNLTCLVEADIRFRIYFEDVSYKDASLKYKLTAENWVGHILDAICDVEKLHLGDYCLQLLSLWGIEVLPSLFSRLETLVLTTNFSELDVIGITTLLRSSPNLNMLCIKLNPSPNKTREERYFIRNQFHKRGEMKKFWSSLAGGVLECGRHLKTVRVVGFSIHHYKTGRCLEFLKFLVKNLLVLQEVSIVSHKSLSLRRKAQVETSKDFQDLLKMSGSSMLAKIIFS